jgi:hypothetical protein
LFAHAIAMRRRAIIGTLAAAAVFLAPAAAGGATGERALELVTPSDPVAGTIRGIFAISADGERAVYTSIGPMPGAPAGDVFANSVATRAPDGWTTAPIGLPYAIELAALELTTSLQALSQDLLSTIWISNRPPFPGAPVAGNFGLYRRGPLGQIELLADLGPIESRFVGASDSADRVVFAAAAHLLPSDAARSEGQSIYESSGSELHQLDVADGGGLLSACGSAVSAASGVSAAGDRVFFANPDPTTGCSDKSRVYLREDGATTTEVSASRCNRPDCNAEQDVTFVGATPDGASAFMTTAQQLVDGDLDGGVDLYRYEVGTGALTLVSQKAAGAGGEATAAPVLVSEDGERVYFHAQGRLTAEGAPDKRNLYIGDGAGLHFVATGVDRLEISTDGRVAALDTKTSLAPGDGDGQRDVYRYDAVNEALAPISFGPGFGGGAFEATIRSPLDGDVSPRTRRSLSADGDRVLFGTAEPLDPADGDQALDVYEWHGAGPQLLSAGPGGGASELAGVSASGGTVLFRTPNGLLPADRDGGELDLYAARIGGGFPEGAEGGCAGSCAAQPVPPPARSQPATIRPQARAAGVPLRLRGNPGKRLARELADSGRAVLAASVPEPGRVAAKMTGAVGGRQRLLARGSAGAVRPGAIRITLFATPLMRRLRADGLGAMLELRQSGRSLARRIVLEGIGR